jgi:hypothetical protein
MLNVHSKIRSYLSGFLENFETSNLCHSCIYMKQRCILIDVNLNPGLISPKKGLYSKCPCNQCILKINCSAKCFKRHEYISSAFLR